jgi:hypothetical protein
MSPVMNVEEEIHRVLGYVMTKELQETDSNYGVIETNTLIEHNCLRL